MSRYDPLKEPSPMWCKLSEAEQIEIVRLYHKRNRIKLPNAMVHAVFHVTVENQVRGLPQAKAALERLVAEGLDRHEAVHAIGSVLAGHMWSLANKPRPQGDPNAPYLEALDRLTAESWRNSE